MNTQQLIGMTEADAVQTIKAAGFDPRIRNRDGQSFMGTGDMSRNRVNLTIEDGIVTKATIG